MLRPRKCPWFPAVMLFLLILLYLVHFSSLSILKHDAFMTHTRDLGNMDQPIWNTLQGRFLEETRADGRQATRLTDHFEPIFIPVSLAFLVWDDVRILLILQTLFIALGAVPIYWLARDRFATKEDPRAGCWMGVAFAVAYLLFPAMQAANLTEFHAVPLAAPLLLCAYYYGRRGDALWFWLFGLLALTVKEDISLMVFMLGLYVFWKGEKRWMGLALAGVSLVWFSVVTFVVIPAASEAFYTDIDQSLYFARYGEFGNSPKDIILNMIRQPLQVLATLTTPARLGYLAGLLASVGFLALFDMGTVLIALPLFMANLLSNYPAMYSGEMHYSAPLVPFMAAGAVGGAGWLSDRIVGRFPARRRMVYITLAIWLLVCSLGYQVLRGYTPLGARYERPVVTEHHRLLDRFVEQIPLDAVLSATPPLFPHVDHRRQMYEFPVVADAEYVLLDASSTTDMHPNDFHQSYLDLFAYDFRIVDSVDGYILLHKSLEGVETLPDEFYSFVRVDRVEPDYAYQVDFEHSLRFLGFSLIDDPLWRLTRVRTYWEVLEKPADALHIYPFFMDREAQIVEDTRERPMVGPIWYPSSEWQAGDLLQLETLPWDVGDEFSFCIGVTRSGVWHDTGSRLRVSNVAGDSPAYVMDDHTWARLLTFERQGAIQGNRFAPVYMADEAHVPAENSVNMRFSNADDVIDLLGFELAEAAGPDDMPALTLYWRADQPVHRDYSVFVHVQTQELGSLPQMDGGPNWRGPMSTSAWSAGEIVPDTHFLSIPPDAQAGSYDVTVGLYYWESMERMGAIGSAGEDLGSEVFLTTLEVGARQ